MDTYLIAGIKKKSCNNNRQAFELIKIVQNNYKVNQIKKLIYEDEEIIK